MNLNTPVLDSVLAIDAQLQKLQQEVMSMDAEFAEFQRNNSPSEIAEEQPSEEKVAPRKVSFAANANAPVRIH